MKHLLTLLCVLALTTNLLAADGPGAERDAFHYNRLLGRGINLGNVFEAPREGDWGLTLQEDFFPLIKKAGFDAVRIPVRWSAHAQAKAPYRIDAKFLARIDWTVDQALKQ